MGLFIIGIIFALANGTIFPLFSLFFSRLLNVLLRLYANSNDTDAINQANLYSLLFLILGIAAFICTTLQLGIFRIIGESITAKLRVEVFKKLLKLPIPFFDIPRNNSGSLAARLATECNQVNALTTTIVAVTLQNISTLITGIVIAFVFEWRTSLVTLGMIPFLMIAGMLEMAFNTGQSQATDEAYKDSASLIMESMINIRTVSSSGHDYIIIKKYEEKLEEPESLLVGKGLLTGFLFGLSQLITYFIFGIIFFVGAVFVRDNADVTVEDMFTAMFALTFAGMGAGNNSHFMPDAGVAQNAAANLFLILDTEDED